MMNPTLTRTPLVTLVRTPESITDDEGKSDEYDRDKLIQAHTVKGQIQTDNCNDTCIFCHEVCGNKLYGYVGFSFQPTSDASRFAISCCPHVAHIECLDAYLAMQNGRANHAIDTTNNAEFLCPLCKRLSNILVPAIPYAYEKIPGDKHEDTTKHALPTDISVPEYSSGLEAQITEKIKFSNGGAEAELLRFISTISNNRYRLEDPSRIHKKIDMLYLLWNAGVIRYQILQM